MIWGSGGGVTNGKIEGKGVGKKNGGKHAIFGFHAAPTQQKFSPAHVCRQLKI